MAITLLYKVDTVIFWEYNRVQAKFLQTKRILEDQRSDHST